MNLVEKKNEIHSELVYDNEIHDNHYYENDNLEVDEDCLVGSLGSGFKYILDGMNAERILIASECIGDAKYFIEKSKSYANERKVFGRPIGKNQSIQFFL